MHTYKLVISVMLTECDGDTVVEYVADVVADGEPEPVTEYDDVTVVVSDDVPEKEPVVEYVGDSVPDVDVDTDPVVVTDRVLEVVVDTDLDTLVESESDAVPL